MQFVQLARRAHAVKRYHTEHTIGHQTIADHSYGVAMLVLYLTDGSASANLIKAALYHDLPEQHTGDTPAPAKWDSPALSDALGAMEDRWAQENGFSVPNLSESDRVVLKWADSLELMFYCLEQRRMGNRYAEQPFYKVVEFLLRYAHHQRGMNIVGDLFNQMKEIRDGSK